MSRVDIGGIGMYTNFQIRPGGPEYVCPLPFVQICFGINQSNPVSFVLSVHYNIFASALRNDVYFPRKYYCTYSQILLTNIHKYPSNIFHLCGVAGHRHTTTFLYMVGLWRQKNVAINFELVFFLYVVGFWKKLQ